MSCVFQLKSYFLREKSRSMSRVSRPVSVAQRFLLSSTHVSLALAWVWCQTSFGDGPGSGTAADAYFERGRTGRGCLFGGRRRGGGCRDGVRQVKALEEKRKKKEGRRAKLN